SPLRVRRLPHGWRRGPGSINAGITRRPRSEPAGGDHKRGLMAVMTESTEGVPLDAPSVRTALPGPASAILLERQELRESSARTYPRRLTIAPKRGQGSYIEDVDGNVFIDFLTGAGVLSLGHSHPELIAAAAEQLGRFVHGLDLPTPAKDAFTEAQLSMLPGRMADRMKMHFCGP